MVKNMMERKKMLRNNKGVALILALGFASVLFTLSIGYVGSAITESNLCQRQQDAVVALYEAERGAQYAATELRNAGWRFFTHQRADTDIDSNGAVDDLQNVTVLPARSITNSTEVGIGYAGGNYRITTALGTTDVRTYVNPAQPDAVFILSRTNIASTNTQKILKMKVSTTSLYENFAFSPYSLSLVSNDGNGIGKIHANGNINWVTNSNITNIDEVSCGGYMHYSYSNRIPGYLLDGLDGIMDGRAPEPASNSSLRGWNQADYDAWYATLNATQRTQAAPRPNATPQAWNMRDYPWMRLNSASGGYPWHPNWNTIRNNFNVSSLQANSGVSYNWSEVTDNSIFSSSVRPHFDWNFGPNSGWPSFYNSAGNNFTTYHGGGYNYTNPYNETFAASHLPSLFGANTTINGVLIPPRLSSGETYAFDPFFKDPMVEDIHNVDFTNTELQPGAWDNFVNTATIPAGQPHYGEPLMSVLKDANTGGEVISPVDVQQGYFQNLALSGGIVIYANGTTNRPLDPGVITNSSFYNTMRPYINNSTAQMDQTIIVDVSALKAWAETDGTVFNGMIYFSGQGCRDCGIRLQEAKVLPNITDSNPNGGLTVYSTRQVYLQGDFDYDSSRDDTYNDATWQPGAIISQNIVYYLSDGFNDPQGSLPAPTHNINYPFIPDDSNYYGQYHNDMPNKANVDSSSKTVTYRASIVSTESLWQDNVLERWRAAPEEGGPTNYNRRHIGANVRYEGSSTYIPDVYRRNRTYGGGVPLLDGYYGNSPIFEYDTNLQDRVPPGDFLGGAQASWQEVSDFNHV